MGDPLDTETQIGSLISEALRERVHSFVEDARDDGAEVVLAASRASTPSIRRRRSGVDKDGIAQEQVFGLVVTIVLFEDEKDAIRIENDVEYGLMASVWKGDPAKGTAGEPDQGRYR